LSTPDDPSPLDTRIDPALVAALFVQHAEELRRFLVGVLRNHEQANDVLQVTFAKAVEMGHTAHEPSLKAWLFRVGFNEAIAVRRRQAVQARANDELGARGPRETPGPDAQLLRLETVQQVRAALERLPVEQREVVRMRIYDEKKFATIAEELHLPLGTVLTRMQLALKKLKKILDGDS
jgi:RNA polymerase sigma factor (sigma-70 family)